MSKLHELLAVEGKLKSEAKSVESQVTQTFSAGERRLVGQSRRYEPLKEGGEWFPNEDVALVTTVGKEFNRFAEVFGNWIDVAVQKECTNSDTSATIEFDDSSFSLPATALLNLESKLAEIRKVVEVIPTNDPAIKWEYNQEAECWQSPVRIQYKTKKVPRNHVLAEATKEHPAQVEMYHEDERVGQWDQVIISGMLSLSDKRGMLDRVDTLIREVKKARQRANDIEAKSFKVSSAIFTYITGVALS